MKLRKVFLMLLLAYKNCMLKTNTNFYRIKEALSFYADIV